MRVIVLNGFPMSGKDSFAQFCIDTNNGNGAIVSMVDCAKEVAKNLGWDGTKDARNRLFLSNLKDLIDGWEDCSYQYVKKFIEGIASPSVTSNEEFASYIVFVMARESIDIERLKRDFNALTVCVRRPEVEDLEQSNHADKNVLDYNYDFYIWNKYDVPMLKDMAAEFVHMLKKGEI